MNNCQKRNISGQALTEFVVGLIVALTLIAGLIQIAIMTKVQTDAMIEAREEAGRNAIMELGGGVGLLSNPRYIRDWDEGADGKRMSVDDEYHTGDPSGFHRSIIDRSVDSPGDWDIISAAPASQYTFLHQDLGVINALGLVKGDSSKTASFEMLPAFRHLIYNSDTIEVECEVWMSLTGGVY